jgi:protein O-GlcNAc transferase
MGAMSVQQQFEAALVHHRAGRLAEAERIYRQILAQQSDHGDALHGLGIVAAQIGRMDAALDLFRRAVAVCPGNAERQNDFGKASMSSGQLEDAIAAYQSAVRLKPDFASAHNNLGYALLAKGLLDEAIASYRRAISVKPEEPQFHNNLGIALGSAGQFAEAGRVFREAIRLKATFAEAHGNLGNVLAGAGQLDEAIAAYRRAIQIKQDYADAYLNLGVALKDVGQLDEAIECCRHAMRLRPDQIVAHSNLIYFMHFHPAYDAKDILEEARRWNQRYAEPLRKLIQPRVNSREPERVLRIGYVSPDFKEHPIGRFMLELLAGHDRDHFQIFCYADVRRTDEVTELLRQRAAHWRTITGFTDIRLANLIRQDQIDILVDLSMHMGCNRLLLFARKPAPVQVTYLAYCSTTGVEAINYRLTDPHMDPPEMNDAFYSEKSIRLPQTYWCYPLDEQSPAVGPLPALGNGYVTFGCLNNFCKVSQGCLELWTELLRRVVGSRLILHALEGTHRDRVRDLLKQRGIDPGRLEFVGKMPLAEYLALYQRIDVALDPFPCVGGTTTCDALWMGVPVVTLAGKQAVGRGGVSLLRNIGLPELIAQAPEQYLQIAAELASDRSRLEELHRTLRVRMRASPLMDAERFARAFEAAYRQIWREWCAKAEGS